MFMIRLSKTSMVLAMALFATLAAFGNITDYASNFAFVQHVFMMDTTTPGNGIMYRAIASPAPCRLYRHHRFEIATAFLCWVGGVQLLRALKSDNLGFQLAKRWAVAGLSLGFLTWQVAFMSVGGEWFGMWMSKQWNGMPDAFRFSSPC